MTGQQTVTEAVRVFMALRGETQIDVARALGVTRSAISMKMTGRTAWSVDDLDDLAEHYGVDAAMFLTPLDRFAPALLAVRDAVTVEYRRLAVAA